MYIQGSLSRERFFKKYATLAGMLIIAVAGFCSSPIVNADVATTVTCRDGTKVEVGGTDHKGVVACFRHGGLSPLPGKATRGMNVSAGTANAEASVQHKRKAMQYESLARKGRPKNAKQKQLIKQYMRLPASQRLGFKSKHSDGATADIWDYGPYAVCFYASVAGGADVVEAGDECHEDWVN